MSQITSRYGRHVSSVRGWQQAGSESDKRTYPCHMPRLKPICTCWPMAAPFSPPPPPPQPHLPWVGTDVWSTDAPTLETLLDPLGSTKAGTQLAELLAKVSLHIVTLFTSDCVRMIEVLQLHAGHFIMKNDMVECFLTAHINNKRGEMKTK